MACPYFMPVRQLESGNWPHPSRLPLGAGWSGQCTAPTHAGTTPPQDVLEKFCNLGYASDCAWVPKDRRWDAVRFAVAAPEDGTITGRKAARHDAPVLRLIYVCERAHRPAERGELRYDLRESAWLELHRDGAIQKMAECFLGTYLKRSTRTELCEGTKP